ncbi:MAG: hypothetical protein JW762_03285 [Dehalococcoidales bacterium]|nr:hypothetical protein [Dehalococcoidales bacterium]
MDVSRTGGAFIERKYVIKAFQTEVWDLMAGVIFQTLPLERVDLLSLNSFKAVLRWKLGFTDIPMNVSGQLVDVSRPDAYGCAIQVKKGPVSLGIHVRINLKDTGDGKTEIICSASEGERRTLAGQLLKGKQRSFAASIFDSIQIRLQELCK